MKNFIFFLFVIFISCSLKSQKISKTEIEFFEKDKETGYFRAKNKSGKYGFVDKDSTLQIPFEYDFLNPFDENLLAYAKNNGKEFYIDTKGKVIIPPEYGKLNLFSEGLLSVKKNGKYGFLDTTGKLVVPFDYDGTGFFRQGLCVVSKNKKYGFINKQGELIIPTIYESVDASHTDNIVVALKNGKWAFFDNQGKQLSDFVFDKVFSAYNLNIKPPSNLSALTTYFKNGAVLVLKDKKYEFLNEKLEQAFPNNKVDSASVFDTYQNAIIKNNGKYGMIKPNGELKVPMEYDYIEYFDTNHLSSEYYNARKGKIFHIYNKDLKKIGESYEPIYNDYSVSTPQIIFKDLKNKYGMVTSSGELIIPFVYDEIYKIEKTHLFIVAKNNKFGIIDDLGKIKTPIIYKELYSLYNKFDDELRNKNLFIADDNKIIDVNNNIKISGFDSLAGVFYNHNFLIVSKNKKFGIIDVDKKVLLPIEYEEISNWVEYSPENRHLIRKNGKFGMIESETFKEKIPPVYEFVFTANDRVFAGKDKKYGIIDLNNKIICPFIYDELKLIPAYRSGFTDYKIYAKKGNEFYEIDFNGKILNSISEKAYKEKTKLYEK